MFLGMFGVKITMIYLLSGILLGVIGGMVLGRLKLEKYLSEWIRQIQVQSENETISWQSEKTRFITRMPVILKDAWGIVRGVLLYIILGIAVGALMHGYVPEGFFERHLSAERWYSVPLAVILAVPMYANAAGIVPVIQVFVAKGVPLGTALAFMMAVVGLSIPEATMLKKIMTWRLIAVFFGTIALFIVILGYLFNLFI